MPKYRLLNNDLRRLIAALLVILFVTLAFAREPLPVDQGKTGLLLTLRKLRSTGRLMHTAAHPDDEDGGMLTLESRGHGNYCVQMTLTRGEGGQNATGKESGDELGLLRTLELLEADRYYNVEQRFSRVADFGFSKTAAETLQKWDAQHTALPDLVRVIRELKPDVIISRFVGDPSDGHGNHQASGILTREAFRDAGDPTKFPEQIKEGLQPWQAKKLYVRGQGDDWNVELDVNQEDPLLGMTYRAWGWQGLKHQLSQGAANWRMPTRMWTSHYKLADTTIPGYKPGHEKDFFDGIDTSLMGLAGRAPQLGFLKPALQELQGFVDQASAVANQDPKQAAVPLLKGLAATEKLIAEVEKAKLDPVAKSDLLVNLRQKRAEFRDGANDALGETFSADAMLPAIDATSDPQSQMWLAAVPGQEITTKLKASPIPVQAATIRFSIANWHGVGPGGGGSLPISQLAIKVPRDAAYTRQYWHRNDEDRDAVYQIDDPQYETLALSPWPFYAVGTYTYEGLTGEIETEVDVAEPKPHPLIVGPAWSVMVPSATLVIPASPNTVGETAATLRSNNAQKAALPEPLTVSGPGISQLSPSYKDGLQRLVAPGNNTERHLSFLVSGHQHQTAANVMAKDRQKEFTTGYRVLTRPDLGTAYYFRKAVQPVSIVDVNVPKHLKVGYIMGAGDDIPEVLASVGVDVHTITPEELKSGDLSKFDTIVLGIRAYESRDDLRENNSRLLDFVKNGGTLMVQYIYNTSQFEEGHFAPYPMTISRNNTDRVTVEEAPVEILAPDSLVFHTPNQITQKDFNGWVQERTLYCPTQWDSHYTALLESHDPNDPPEKGGLLIAKYGKGTYIFNAWAFNRQLPAGVPGAIRLYVNLLAAGHK
jgi:LmbE family N-acetylglucosaminyl deacetylase